jgi:TolB-like protein/cytochrome c-type biogenesis protein CcmH/NrfG
MSLLAELRRRSVVRVAAAYLVVGWLLTEVLTTILPTLGAPEWASRAIILIFAFGFIPAVVLSWFFEITPEGIKREQDVDREHPGNRVVARRVDQVTIGSAIVLIIVVGLFSARYTADDPSAVDLVVSDTSVAVLPFVNMSGDKDNEYFSDGLTETLLHMLAQIPDLKVAARTSSFAFKDQNLGIKAIAEALEVAHVLEGSVQRAGDEVRITAQLIRASDGFHVWSQVYDRRLDDIFAIQDEIASHVGAALSASLLGTEGETRLAGVTTTDPDAYDLYLLARKERATYSYGGLQAAEDLLKGALLIDPDFTDAKTELASSYIHQFETGLMDQRTAIAEIVAITDQVLTERPDDPVAKATSIYAKALSLASQGDEAAMPDLVNELETIVERSPSSLEPRLLLVRAYKAVQRTEECIPILEESLALDPFNPTLHYELGTALMQNEGWDEARAALEKSLEIEPAQPNAYTYLGLLSLREGDGVGMARALTNAINVDPKDHELPSMLAVFLYRLGLVEIGDAFRERVLALAPTSSVAYQLDMLRAISVGDVAGSVVAARKTIEDKVEDRRFVFGGAVQHLIRTAALEERIEEELAWINEQEPGIFDVDAARVPQRYRNVQGVAFDAWTQILPLEEVQRRLDVVLAYAESQGFDPAENPDAHVSILAIRGQTDEAIEVALEEIFSESVALHLDWRADWMQPQFADIIADPRVQDAMLRWEEEEEALRGSVQSWFSDMHAAN